MKVYSGVNYLKIDIANNFGKDKLLFEDRISWFDFVIANKITVNSTDEELINIINELNADEPELAYAGLLAYKAYLNNEPSGYMISLDATSSGIQIMSALTGDEIGMRICNLSEDNYRYDCYTELYELMTDRWLKKTNQKLSISRSDMKKAIMVMMYGGKKTAIKYLNNDEALYDTLLDCCKLGISGANRLKDALIATIDKSITSYSWTMLDGFLSEVNTYALYREERIVNERKIRVKYKDIGTSISYRGNAANLIHSIDAMIMRELIGRCYYDEKAVKNVMKRIDTILKMKTSDIKDMLYINEEYKNNILENLLNIYNKTGYVSVRLFDYIKTDLDVALIILNVDANFISKLFKLGETMLKYEPFEVLAVHDCFKCAPNKGNYVRYWYKEILQELVKADAIKFLLSQLPSGIIQYNRYALKMEDIDNICNMISNSNYALC